MKIDPWGSSTYQDYARLRDEFGIEEFSDNLWKDLPKPHKLLSRGVVFKLLRNILLKKNHGLF